MFIQSNYSLYIEEVNSLSSEITSTLKAWDTLGREKMGQATEEKEQSIFLSLYLIAGATKRNLEREPGKNRIYVCKDINYPGTIQAIMLVHLKGKELFIDSLVTNPHNVRSSVNEREPQKTKGAGSALVYSVFQRCLEENLSAVSLYSPLDSTEFYLRCGFKEGKEEDSLTVSLEKIREYLARVPSIRDAA